MNLEREFSNDFSEGLLKNETPSVKISQGYTASDSTGLCQGWLG